MCCCVYDVCHPPFLPTHHVAASRPLRWAKCRCRAHPPCRPGLQTRPSRLDGPRARPRRRRRRIPCSRWHPLGPPLPLRWSWKRNCTPRATARTLQVRRSRYSGAARAAHPQRTSPPRTTVSNSCRRAPHSRLVVGGGGRRPHDYHVRPQGRGRRHSGQGRHFPPAEPQRARWRCAHLHHNRGKGTSLRASERSSCQCIYDLICRPPPLLPSRSR